MSSRKFKVYSQLSTTSYHIPVYSLFSHISPSRYNEAKPISVYMKTIHHIISWGIPYLILLVLLSTLSFFGYGVLQNNLQLIQSQEAQVFLVGTIIFIGFLINRTAPKTGMPSFIWVLFAGIALQPVLAVFTKHLEFLQIIMEIFAAIILFEGGIGVPFRNFKKWFFPIATLSIGGVVLSSVAFGGVLFGLLNVTGEFQQAFIPSVLILSVALASTDPTAIIPMLNSLKLKRPFVKQIAISESALTDVSGSIITRLLLVAFISIPAGASSMGILSYLSPILEGGLYTKLATQIFTGLLIGSLGYFLIRTLYNTGNTVDRADPALLIAVPIFMFALGNAIAGAGFLAAFFSGLLSQVNGEIKQASHFYENFLSHLVVPFIFIILGALVPVNTLFAFAPLGILAGLLFVFVIRPLVVFITLLPWLIRNTFELEDLIFLSFIRETGIIPAVLLIIASSNAVIESDFILSIGMWVILITLLIEPPLTPILSRRLGLTADSEAKSSQNN